MEASWSEYASETRNGKRVRLLVNHCGWFRVVYDGKTLSTVFRDTAERAIEVFMYAEEYAETD